MLDCCCLLRPPRLPHRTSCVCFLPAACCPACLPALPACLRLLHPPISLWPSESKTSSGTQATQRIARSRKYRVLLLLRSNEGHISASLRHSKSPVRVSQSPVRVSRLLCLVPCAVLRVLLLLPQGLGRSESVPNCCFLLRPPTIPQALAVSASCLLLAALPACLPASPACLRPLPPPISLRPSESVRVTRSESPVRVTCPSHPSLRVSSPSPCRHSPPISRLGCVCLSRAAAGG